MSSNGSCQDKAEKKDIKKKKKASWTIPTLPFSICLLFPWDDVLTFFSLTYYTGCWCSYLFLTTTIFVFQWQILTFFILMIKAWTKIVPWPRVRYHELLIQIMYSFWVRFRNFLHKFTWIVLSVHKSNILGKFWKIYGQLLNIISSYGWYGKLLRRSHNF